MVSDNLKIILKSSFLFLIFFSTCFANTINTYPGYFWGTVTTDNNKIEGQGLQGIVNQGIQWINLPKNITLKSYIAYGTRLRTINREYYDTHGPKLGIELSWEFLNFGIDYEWNTYLGTKEKTKNFFIYTTWYRQIDLLNKTSLPPSLFGISILGLPTTSWGQLFYDFNNLEGLGSLGWINQGISWFQFPKNIIFKTLALYHWRIRSKNSKYYNVHGPGIGIELERYGLNFGAEYSWKRYSKLSTSYQGLQLYLTYFFNWV